MEIISPIILAVFGTMVVSPDTFFKKVESFLREESTTSEFPCAFGPPTTHEYNLVHEQSRLDRLNKIIASTTNQEAKRIWELKRTEYLRELKWRSLKEGVQGTERTV